MYNAYDVLSWQSQIFYICKPYLFFHIYDPLSILCLALILVSVNVYDGFTEIHKDFIFGSHICCFTFMNT